MSDRPLVSIIIPVYNAEEYLNECIESILGQTYKNIEVILINDGSTDNSLSILKEYSKQDDRVNFLSIDNSGPGACRNVGLNLFKGDYVMFVDSDDIISKDLVTILLQNVGNISEVSMCKFSKDIKKFSQGTKKLEKQTSSFIEGIRMMYLPGFASSGPVTKLYGRALFDKLRFPDIPMYEDAAISIQIISLASKVSFVDYYGYYYRFNPESITNKKVSERNFSIFEKTDILLNFAKQEHPEALSIIKKICLNDNDYVMMECMRNSSELSKDLFNKLLEQNRELSKELGVRRFVYASGPMLKLGLKFVNKIYYNDFVRNSFKKVLGV